MPYRMPHRAITAVLASAFLLGVQASFSSAGDDQAVSTTDDARVLMLEEARAVQSMDHFAVSHQVDITTTTPHYNQTTHAYIKTWVQRPGHVRAESQQYTRNETIVSDGSTTWIYDAGNRTYWSQRGGAPAALFANAFPGLARQLSNANLPAVITSARLVGTESLTITGRSYPCNIVDISITPGAAEAMLQDNLLRLWISRDYKVPLRVEATLGAAPQDHKKYADYVTDFEPDMSIPASVWTFKPPPDAKQRSYN